MLAPVTEIFCDIDDFCKEFYKNQSIKLLPKTERKRKRECKLSISEIMTIMVLFQLSHYRTFKDFYNECVLHDLRKYFPNFLSYNRFVELQSSIIQMLTMYMVSKTGKETAIYYVDATSLKVCNNRRISSHKTFKDIAKRGKTSMGWFFGFKLHLVVNHIGEIMSFCLTRGNVDDRKTVRHMLKKLKGTVAGDRGYISKELTEDLHKIGINFLTKTKKKMAEKTFSTFEKMVMSGRAIIETIFDQMKAICQIEHTRHRKPDNFLANLIAGLVAYTIRPKKPKISQNYSQNSMKVL